MNAPLKAGDRVRITGDTSSLWIQDYNVRVNSEATVLETPARYAKKVFVCIDYIDHESNVNLYVKRAACFPAD